MAVDPKVLEAIQARKAELEALIRESSEELEQVQKDEKAILGAQTTAAKYLPLDQLPIERVVPGDRRGASLKPPVGLDRETRVKRLVDFLIDAFLKERRFDNIKDLAQEVHTLLGYTPGVAANILQKELLDEIYNNLKFYDKKPQLKRRVSDFRIYLRYCKEGFSLKGKKLQKPKHVSWWLGDKDPLAKIPRGGKTAALAFEALFCSSNAELCSSQTPIEYKDMCRKRPVSLEEVIERMMVINRIAGFPVARIEFQRNAAPALREAFERAIKGDSSCLGDLRVQRVLKSFASLEAFLEGCLDHLIKGEILKLPAIKSVQVTEAHLATAAHD